ncbi:MAG: hypothetical protein M9899_01450 [Bdellovibrionaceae bacterium]|nr:hypothetical protein [Pseudobdellovibrionaceae bacterium]
MFKFLWLFLSVSLFSFSTAHALELSLVQKLAGPDSWDCPQDVTLNITNEELTLTATTPTETGGFYQFRIGELNQGTVCRDLNSSYIFGGIRCYASDLVEDQYSIKAEARSCTREVFRWNCDPYSTEPVSEFLYDKQSKIVTTQALINWQDDPYYSCKYIVK